MQTFARGTSADREEAKETSDGCNTADGGADGNELVEHDDAVVIIGRPFLELRVAFDFFVADVESAQLTALVLRDEETDGETDAQVGQVQNGHNRVVPRLLFRSGSRHLEIGKALLSRLYRCRNSKLSRVSSRETKFESILCVKEDR